MKKLSLMVFLSMSAVSILRAEMLELRKMPTGWNAELVNSNIHCDHTNFYGKPNIVWHAYKSKREGVAGTSFVSKEFCESLKFFVEDSLARLPVEMSTGNLKLDMLYRGIPDDGFELVGYFKSDSIVIEMAKR